MYHAKSPKVASDVNRAPAEPKAKMFDSEADVACAVRAWSIGAADEIWPVIRFSTHTELSTSYPSPPPIMNTFPA